MIIHINRTRFDNIQSLSFKFPVQHPRILTGPVTLGDNEIHLLDGEVALCEMCEAGVFYTSITANTPAEYDTAKLMLSKRAETSYV